MSVAGVSDEGGAHGMTGDLLEGRGDWTGEEVRTPDTGTEVLGLVNVWEEEKRLGDLRQNKQTGDVLMGGKVQTGMSNEKLEEKMKNLQNCDRICRFSPTMVILKQEINSGVRFTSM